MVTIGRKPFYPSQREHFGGVSNPAYAKAQEFAQNIRKRFPSLNSPEMAKRLFQETIDPAALYQADHEVAVRTVAFASGMHRALKNYLMGADKKGKFAAQIVRDLLKEKYAGEYGHVYFYTVFSLFQEDLQFIGKHGLDPLFFYRVSTGKARACGHSAFILIEVYLEDMSFNAIRSCRLWNKYPQKTRDSLLKMFPFAAEAIQAHWQKAQVSQKEGELKLPSAEVMAKAQVMARLIRQEFPELDSPDRALEMLTGLFKNTLATEFAKADNSLELLPPAVKPEKWKREFGSPPKVSRQIKDFAKQAWPKETLGEIGYCSSASKKFVEMFTEKERPRAFLELWRVRPKLAAAIARSVKFHAASRDLLAGLNDAHLAHVLDASMVSCPAFDNKPAIDGFDKHDSGILVRGLCLLPRDRVERVLNQVTVQTLTYLLDQAYMLNGNVLSPDRSRAYVHELLVPVRKEGGVGRDKVSRALLGCQPPTQKWVKRVYEGTLDVPMARAQAEKLYGSCQEARQIEEILREITLEKLIPIMDPTAGYFKALREQFPDDVPRELRTAQIEPWELKYPVQIVLKIGRTWRMLQQLEARALIAGDQALAISKELFLIKKTFAGALNGLAEEIYAGRIEGGLAPLGKGRAIGQLAVIREEGLQLVSALSSLQPFQIPVLSDDYPTAWSGTAPVAGMVVCSKSGKYSHASMRAQECGAPVFCLDAAPELLKHFDGKWVVVNEDGTMRLANSKEQDEARKKQRILPVQVHELGPKATKLADLKQRGFNVPPAQYITAELCREFYKENGWFGLFPQILGIEVVDQTVMAHRLKQIRDLMLKAMVPETIYKVMSDLNRDLPGEDRIFRPSSSLEDREDIMGAGFLESPVSTSRLSLVLRAMKTGWASYWNWLPYSLRVQNGLNHFDHLPGGILMQLILARAAGNMIVRKDRVEVQAVYGQGQAFTDGETKPDQWEMDRLTGELHQSTGDYDPHPTKRVFVDGKLVSRPLSQKEEVESPLNQDEAAELIEQGIKIHDIYGPAPRDVEWAMSNDGRIWIVQDRTFRGK